MEAEQSRLDLSAPGFWRFGGLYVHELNLLLNAVLPLASVLAGMSALAITVFALAGQISVFHAAMFLPICLAIVGLPLLRHRLQPKYLGRIFTLLLLAAASALAATLSQAFSGYALVALALSFMLMCCGTLTATGAMVVALGGLSTLRMAFQHTSLALELPMVGLGLFTTSALGVCTFVLIHTASRWHTLQARSARQLRQLMQNQEQLFTFLTQQLDEPTQELHELQKKASLERSDIPRINTIAHNLIQSIEDLRNTVSTFDMPPVFYQDCNLHALVEDVGKQTNNLLKKKGVALTLRMKQLPITSYRVDITRLRAILLTAPHTMFLLHDRFSQLIVSVGSERLTDNTHNLCLCFEVDATKFSLEQALNAMQQTDHPITAEELTLHTNLGNMAKWITELGGSYELSVPEGSSHGIVLRVQLPVEPAALQDNPLDSPSKPKVGYLQNTRVIMVDDDAVHRRASARLLSKGFGADVVTAAGGREALDLLEQGLDYEMIITDFAMPDMNGADLIQRVHRLRPHLPVIAVTSTTLSAELMKLRTAGANAVITKPLTTEKLQLALDEVVASRAARFDQH